MCRIHLSVPSIVAWLRDDLWPDFFLSALFPYTLWVIFLISTHKSIFLIAEISFFYILLHKSWAWINDLLATLNAFEDEMGLIMPAKAPQSPAPWHASARRNLFPSRTLD